MTKFIVKVKDKQRYLQSCYRNSVSTSDDLGDALEFNVKEQALAFMIYAEEKDTSNHYELLAITMSYEILK